MLSAIINAGGNSTRMGRHKALLPVPPAGEPILARTVAAAAAVVDESIIVVSNHAPVRAAAARLPNVMVIGDDTPDQGPLAGLAAGLRRVSGWTLALACDLPLLQVELLRLLAGRCGHASPAQADAWDAVVPVVDGRAQTLAAAYHRRCLPFVEAMLAQGSLRIRDLFTHRRVLYVEEAELRKADPTLQSFVNANTPQEWEAICRCIAG
jgi:molybdopterin-guanine dinucleotide biosynthesis protein A